MGPKKKGGKKDKKGGDDKDKGLSAEKLLALRIDALERELVSRTEKMNRAIAAQNELRTRVNGLNEAFSREEENMFAITADMTRQYKQMQEELIRANQEIEAKLEGYKDELDQSTRALEETKREKDQVIAMKDSQISDLKQRMEDMAIEFGDMLKETLDKMTDRIDSSHTEWEKSVDLDGIGSRKMDPLGKTV